MKNLLYCLVVLANGAYAGTGWYVTIRNHTNTPLEATAAGMDCWKSGDFANPQLVKPGEINHYYTEQGSCITNSGILGLDIQDLPGPVKIGHVELLQFLHSYTVDQYLSSWHGANQSPLDLYLIGSNNQHVLTSLKGVHEGAYDTMYANIDIYYEQDLPPAGDWIHSCLMTSYSQQVLAAECQDQASWWQCNKGPNGCPYISSSLNLANCPANFKIVNHNGQLTCAYFNGEMPSNV